MLERLNKIAKLSRKQAIRYGVMAVSVIVWMYFFAWMWVTGVHRVGWPAEISTFIWNFALLNSLSIISLIWVCEPVEATDRRLVLRQMMWFIWPWTIILNLWFFTPTLPFPLLPLRQLVDIAPGSPLIILESFTNLLGDLLSWVVLMYTYFIWFSLRWPFMKRNLALHAKNGPTTRAVLERAIWPMTLEEANMSEIRISPRLYYSLLALLFWITFVVLETVLSEFLEERLGSAGYLGTSAIAISIGAAFYPIHKRASKYVNARSSIEAKSNVTDFKSLFTVVGRSLRVHSAVQERLFPRRIRRRVQLYFALAFAGLVLILIMIGIYDTLNLRS